MAIFEANCKDSSAISRRVCKKVAIRISEAEATMNNLLARLEDPHVSGPHLCQVSHTSLQSQQFKQLEGDVHNVLKNQCIKEDQNRGKGNCIREIGCSINSSLILIASLGLADFIIPAREAGEDSCISFKDECLTNLMTGLIDMVVTSIKDVWTLIKMTGSWGIEKGRNFWDWVVSAEDETSKTQEVIQGLSQEDIEEIEKEPKGWPTKVLKGISVMFSEWMRTDIFCEKWSGTPHLSECTQPMKGWGCLGCQAMITGICSAGGSLIGLLGESFLAGGVISALAKGSGGIKAALNMIKSSSNYKQAITRVKATKFVRQMIQGGAKHSGLGTAVSTPFKVTVHTLKSGFTRLKDTGIFDQARAFLSSLGKTWLGRAVVKLDEVDSKAFDLGRQAADSSFDATADVLTRGHKASRATSIKEKVESKLRLVARDDEILRKEITLVEESEIKTPKFQQFVDELDQVMIKSEALGIAANQVGVDKSVFIVQKVLGENLALINPKVKVLSKKQILSYEECLSFKGKCGIIKRNRNIEVVYSDRYGKSQIWRPRWPNSIVVQHEADHLKGILWTYHQKKFSKKFGVKGMNLISLEKRIDFHRYLDGLGPTEKLKIRKISPGINNVFSKLEEHKSVLGVLENLNVDEKFDFALGIFKTLISNKSLDEQVKLISLKAKTDKEALAIYDILKRVDSANSKQIIARLKDKKSFSVTNHFHARGPPFDHPLTLVFKGIGEESEVTHTVLNIDDAIKYSRYIDRYQIKYDPSTKLFNLTVPDGDGPASIVIKDLDKVFHLLKKFE